MGWTLDAKTKADQAVVTADSTIKIDSGENFIIQNSSSQTVASFAESATGTIVFNEQGSAMDFRVEGDNDTHTLFVDGSTDRVGINVSDPDSKLEILEATDNQLKLSYDGSNATTFNTSSGGDLTIVPSGGDANVTGNLAVSGDLTITGDDLFMNTNTSGYVLVADGTNYNPVAISGDVTLNSAGAITIANDAVEQAMIGDDAVGADQLASNAVVNASIASGAAIDMDKLDGDSLGTAITDFAQDDLMILSDTSDSGNLVKMTTSNFEDAIFGNVSGDASIAAGGALTIAADSVEGTMLNTNAADTSTIELSSDTLSVLKVPNALTAGDGISAGGTFDGATARTFALDLNELSAATVSVANDSIAIIDADGSNASKKESIADLVSGIASTGLDASSGQLSVDVSDFMANGADNYIVTATGADAMNAEANLTFVGTDLGIAATCKIYLDGSGDTYIHEAGADQFEISVGGTDMLTLKQDSGKHILFAGANAGHALQTTSYSLNSLTSSGGTHDTDVDFTDTSKRILTMTGDINQLNVICPKSVSSNLTLKIVHSGGAFDVSTWRVWRDNNGTLADTSANVKWPGGSAPTLSGADGDVDIITFWWDGTNYLCYGNAALDFS